MDIGHKKIKQPINEIRVCIFNSIVTSIILLKMIDFYLKF